MYYLTTYPSPIGTITLACDDDNLIGLWLDTQKYHADTVPGKMISKDDTPVFAATKKWLDRYFAGENPAISKLTLAPIGSEFRRMVWNILREIPYGEVITYGDIASEISVKRNGKKMAAQAVGGAVGHNPISIIIPCHRVVGANGNLTGYGGGMSKKVKLLELEGADMSKFFVPS